MLLSRNPDNPFASWSIDQQTRDAYARDVYGQECDAYCADAVCFCASGWLRFKLVRPSRINAFNRFLIDRYEGRSIADLNDVGGWTPNHFYDAWENFLMAEGSKMYDRK